MLSRRYAKWLLGSCEAVTRANHRHFLPRDGHWAPIVRGDGVVHGAAIGVGMGKPTVFNTYGLGSKINTQPPIGRSHERVSMLNSRESSRTTVTSETAWL
jgi:hypothetical protein